MMCIPSRPRRPARRLSSHAWRTWPAALGLLFAVSATAQTAATGPVLSLHDAVQVATGRALSPAAATASAQAARERAVAAAQRPDPVLRLSLDNLPIEGADRFSPSRDSMTQRSISLLQTFTRADKLSARAERFEREAQAALAERSVRIAAVQRDTAIAWFERRAAEQRHALLLLTLSEAQKQIDAAEAGLRGARIPLAEVIELRDGLAQLAQAQLDVDAELGMARRALARWTGSAVPGALAESASLATHRFAAASAEARLAQHPDLLRLAAAEAQADAEAQVPRAEREPDWSAELVFSQRGARYADMVSISVSLPLPWDRPQRQDRELAARLAQAEALRNEREELAREQLAQVESWIDSWQAGLARLALVDRHRAPLAQQRIEAALAAYRGAQAPLSAVLGARRAALALQMERIDIELQTARLWARLEFLIPHDTTTATAPAPRQGAPR
jgi:cobalt-zinc-cadmium efflux system outer membrane protein